MLAEDPVKMMKNLHSMAEEGCLLGITVVGKAELSNLMSIMPEALKAKGVPIPNARSAFHLYNKL